MRNLSLAAAVSAAAILVASAADARPVIGASSHRLGGEATARTQDRTTLIETIATVFGFTLSATATPVVGAETPRSAAPRTEQCEEEKKRADAARATQTRRTAEAEKRSRGGEPVYLAF
jgi:hypothetical protein